MNDAPHAHDHDHGHDANTQSHAHAMNRQGGSRTLRLSVAVLLLIVAAFAATLVVVPHGSALVVTRFGDPIRVEIKPGLSWRIPAPIERTLSVDLRLHTTATGLHDVGTKDGLRIQLAAFVAWRVPADQQVILAHLRAVRGDADEAAGQLRSFLGSALETEASRFALDELVNTDAKRVRLDALEQALAKRLAEQVRDTYGIELMQVGIERLGMPESTINATIERMIAERQTAAVQRKAAGAQLAAEINQEAFRDSRIVIAKAQEEVSAIEAKSRTEVAAIYSKTYATDPELYSFLRGLDTLEKIVTSGTRLILRTDAAPFRALVEGPGLPSATSPPTPAPAPTLKNDKP
jgi:modulator of FtsH protease HflC